VNFAEAVKREIRSADVVIGLVTPSSVESHWVLFELGARWGMDRPLFSVLARGADTSVLPDPIKSYHSLKVNAAEPGGVEKLVEEVAAVLKRPCATPWQYKTAVAEFIAACSEPCEPTREPATAALSALDAFKARYKYEETVCWKYDSTGKRDGPYCPSCVDEEKESRLVPLPTPGKYRCVNHKGFLFTTGEYQADTPRRARGNDDEYSPWS
jgi:hypothetical protein